VSLEVSASIMLYTAHTVPLSVHLWIGMHNGQLGEAFAIAAILSTLTFIVVAFAQWRFRVLDRF
jgi:ABC-type Fe3+ transport system permease subunit